MGRDKRKKLTKLQTEDFFHEHGGICWRCKQPIDSVREKWIRGHVIDLACGGSDEPDNWRPEHQRCNKEHADTVGNKMAAKVKRVRQRNMGIKKPATFRKPVREGFKYNSWKRKWEPI